MNCARRLITPAANAVEITTRYGADKVKVVSPRPGLHEQLQSRLRALIAYEESFAFNPGRNLEHLAELRRSLEQ